MSAYISFKHLVAIAFIALVAALSIMEPSRASEPIEVNVVLPPTGSATFLGSTELES